MADRKNKDEKAPPSNIDAEKTILGAILLECSCSDKAEWMVSWNTAMLLDPDDFMLDSHRRIFLRMKNLIEEDSQVDIVTLANKLTEKKEIDSVGGVAYIASLTEDLPRRPRIRDYVKIVKAKSLLRKLILTCSHAVDRAYDGESGFGIIEELKESVSNIEASATRGMRPYENS